MSTLSQIFHSFALCGIITTGSLAREVELIEDTKFAEGFGASWYYGSKFSGPNHREGRVLAYRNIPAPDQVWLIPGRKVSELTEPIEHPWDFEEGLHHDYTDPITGKRVSDLHRHRFVVNHKLEADTPDKLQFAQFNNEGLKPGDPAWDTKLVKRITSNRRGTIQVYYNTQNSHRNAATEHSEKWSRDTWPHLLLNQTFKDRPRLADFERLDFTMTTTVHQLDRLSDFPNEYAAMNWKFMFFLRAIENPKQSLFAGMMLYTSAADRLYEPHTGVDQHGTVFYRDSIIRHGPKPKPGETRTVNLELKSMVRDALVEANRKQPAISTNPDDFYLFNIAIGWEGLGHWECDAVMKDLSLKGVPRKRD